MDKKIISEKMGHMFEFDKTKEPPLERLKDGVVFKYKKAKEAYYDICHIFINHFRWHKTLKQIRPWEGFEGMLRLMETQLKHHIKQTQKHSIASQVYRDKSIKSAATAIRVLRRLRAQDYLSRRTEQVRAKYPKYKYHITEYTNSTSYSGNFVEYKGGWVGRESGKDPRSGYFEFVNGRLAQKPSPNEAETDKLLAQIDSYNQEMSKAYALAKNDNERDFERLHKILKNSMYTWWD